MANITTRRTRHTVLTDWECETCDHTEEEAQELGSKTTLSLGYLGDTVSVETPICGECDDEMGLICTYLAN